MLCSRILYGQTINIEEPEFIGLVVYVNDTIGKGIKLEQQNAIMKSKNNAVSYVPVVGIAGKHKTKSVVKGCCSNVIIKDKKNVQFIVSVINNTIDPSSLIDIFKLESKKDTRSVELSSISTFGGLKSNDLNYINFSAKKYGKSSEVS